MGLQASCWLNKMERLHAIIYGRVQGVSFRAYTQAHAEQVGLVGCVRNTPNGQVETVAEGKSEAIESLLQFLQRGSQFDVVF